MTQSLGSNQKKRKGTFHYLHVGKKRPQVPGKEKGFALNGIKRGEGGNPSFFNQVGEREEKSLIPFERGKSPSTHQKGERKRVFLLHDKKRSLNLTRKKNKKRNPPPMKRNREMP